MTIEAIKHKLEYAIKNSIALVQNITVQQATHSCLWILADDEYPLMLIFERDGKLQLSLNGEKFSFEAQRHYPIQMGWLMGVLATEHEAFSAVHALNILDEIQDFLVGTDDPLGED
jgi:hypothetical protein